MPARGQSEEFAPFRPLFENLTSDDENTRLKASLAILSGLKQASPGVVRRVIDRLMAGLTSGRKSARIGFSVTLTELLSSWYEGEIGKGPKSLISFPDLVSMLRSSTQPEGGLGGQERKDHYLGRLFGLKAILDSRMLLQAYRYDHHWTLMLDTIFELASKKSWLREECGWIVTEFIKSCDVHPYTQDLAKAVIDRLCANKMALTPEGVAIWLTVQDLPVEVLLPAQPWQNRDPLDPDNLDQLAGVMRDVPMVEDAVTGKNDAGQSSRGIWSARPNFAWMLVLDRWYREATDTKGFLFFSRFWTRVVDENLFAPTASPERKHLGFMLLASATQAAPRSFLAALFSKNAARCLANHVSSEERYLHSAAMKCLREMQARVERDPDSACDFLKGLTFRGGVANFDELTKTKTLRSILGKLSEEGRQRIVEYWDDHLHYLPLKDDEVSDTQVRALADLAVALLRSHDSHDTSTCTSKALGFLATHAYTSDGEPTDIDFDARSPSNKKYFAGKLSSCFGHLMSVGASTSSRVIWPADVLQHLESAAVGECRSWADDLDRKEIKKVVAGFWKRSPRLRLAASNGDKTRARYLQALEWLYSLLIFEMYNGNEEAIPVLSDVKVICDKALDRDGEDTSAVLTELLLMLVFKPSVLLRKLAQQVFGAFTSELSADSLQLLYDVLASPESLAGQQQIFDQDADMEEMQPEATNGHQSRKRKRVDDEEDDASEEGHEGHDDDDEDETMPDADSESASSDAEDNNASDDSDDNDDETARLNAALASIVGTKPFNPADEKSDNSDSDAASQTSSAMFALDEQLAQVFRERQKHHQQPSKTQRQSQKDARTNMIQFKNRVLDLLEIYLKQEHTNPFVLSSLLPLLELIRTTRTKQLADRASTTLRNLSQRCKGRDNAPRLSSSSSSPSSSSKLSPPITLGEDTLDLLSGIHEEASQKGTSKAHAAGCSQASLLVVKALVYNADTPKKEKKMIKGVAKIYARTQTRWLLDHGGGRTGGGNGGLQPGFFTDFVNWGQSFRQHQ
ncbi:MAG: hypothetical protein M1823_001961 [Watsoniomyces obsoletus]|nr:MAG: hypothetical protein M1823_001961 [Watsoniomyces obsoletus]